MPDFIATYDILNAPPGAHEAFKAAAQNHGWSRELTSHDGLIGQLPNTTLWGQFADITAAEAAFLSIRPTAEVSLRRQFPVSPYLIALAPQTKLEPSHPPRRVGGIGGLGGFAGTGLRNVR